VMKRVSNVISYKRYNYLEALAGTDVLDKIFHLGTLLKGRAIHQLPVVEHHLGEGLARRGGTKITVEAEGLHDGEVGLDGEHGCTNALLLAEDLSTFPVQAGVDTTNSILRALHLNYNMESATDSDTWLVIQKRNIPRKTGSWRPGSANKQAA
jgi:hypothetical protein